jgi:hypothetical protein
MTTTADWWAGVPALGTALTRREADRLTALACAVKMTSVGATDAGWTGEAHKTERIAEHLADWLGEDGVDDAEARRRRICLCLTIDLGAKGAEWRHIRDSAKWMLTFITDR